MRVILIRHDRMTAAFRAFMTLPDITKSQLPIVLTSIKHRLLQDSADKAAVQKILSSVLSGASV